METSLQKQEGQQLDIQTLFHLITNGDTSKLTQEQKLQYYHARCQAAGLDPRTQPFQYILTPTKKGNVEKLYANKECASQLIAKHSISIGKPEIEIIDGMCIVTVEAKKGSQSVSNIGVVVIEKIYGDMKANAVKRANTQAIRRSVLALCGLGEMDETEAEDVISVELEEVNAAVQRIGDLVRELSPEEAIKILDHDILNKLVEKGFNPRNAVWKLLTDLKNEQNIQAINQVITTLSDALQKRKEDIIDVALSEKGKSIWSMIEEFCKLDNTSEFTLENIGISKKEMDEVHAEFNSAKLIEKQEDGSFIALPFRVQEQ